MTNVSLFVIDQSPADTRSVLVSDGFPPQPLIRGTGGTVNYLCGACDFVLAEAMENAAQIAAFVLKCPRCSAHNATRT